MPRAERVAHVRHLEFDLGRFTGRERFRLRKAVPELAAERVAAQQVDILPASNKKTQLNKVLETLYAQETLWEESDYEKLSISLRRAFNQRSLLILFTNFESMPGLQRQLPYLRKLSRYHLLLVVFFENTALKKVTEQRVSGVEEIYKQVIA